MSGAHIDPASLEIGEFCAHGDHLTASVRVVLCGRIEDLTVIAHVTNAAIEVEVDEPLLDYAALTVVAERVAARLGAARTRATLETAVLNPGERRRRGPFVCVRLPASP